jgi:DUF1365 family protein
VTLQSSLYVGSVMHRRLRPRLHHFRYRAFWLLIDLDELPIISKALKLFSHNRPNIFSLHDTDHGDGTAVPLRAQVGRRLREAGLDIGGGRIRLLCMPRTLGYCFNPLSIYFCHHANGSLAAMIYQVHNTFGERHSYIIPVNQAFDSTRQRCRKRFHVSPFMDMDMRYEFRAAVLDKRIAVGIRVCEKDAPMLNAVLVGAREELTDRALLRVGLTIPAVTVKVMAAIHWEALRLWLKGIGIRRKPPAPVRAVSIGSATPRNAD